LTDSAAAGEAWQRALSADRPTVIEAIVDAATPLLPPLMPESKTDKVLDAVAREPGDAAGERVREQQQRDD
jgi:pyruvate dehydrogenase (quinone)